MPSQYRPQILGWIDDLDKGTNQFKRRKIYVGARNTF